MQTVEDQTLSLGILHIFDMEYGVSNFRKVKFVYTKFLAVPKQYHIMKMLFDRI